LLQKKKLEKKTKKKKCQLDIYRIFTYLVNQNLFKLIIVIEQLGESGFYSKKLAWQGLAVSSDMSEKFQDCRLITPVQYVTGMKLYARRWEDRQVIGGK